MQKNAVFHKAISICLLYLYKYLLWFLSYITIHRGHKIEVKTISLPQRYVSTKKIRNTMRSLSIPLTRKKINIEITLLVWHISFIIICSESKCWLFIRFNSRNQHSCQIQFILNVNILRQCLFMCPLLIPLVIWDPHEKHIQIKIVPISSSYLCWQY